MVDYHALSEILASNQDAAKVSFTVGAFEVDDCGRTRFANEWTDCVEQAFLGGEEMKLKTEIGVSALRNKRPSRFSPGPARFRR